ncbi:hypothetical protein WJX73_007762 [Symbiochloris irregularis]|uniref:Uncharacterized protein n=1 Tax=Symbiochloris irregularis TaxID=706552 RepID=A0AAW1NZ05_9CHLO
MPVTFMSTAIRLSQGLTGYLTSITISGPASAKDLTPLSALPRLSRLHLGSIELDKDPSDSEFTALRDVAILGPLTMPEPDDSLSYLLCEKFAKGSLHHLRIADRPTCEGFTTAKSAELPNPISLLMMVGTEKTFRFGPELANLRVLALVNLEYPVRVSLFTAPIKLEALSLAGYMARGGLGHKTLAALRTIRVLDLRRAKFPTTFSLKVVLLSLSKVRLLAISKKGLSGLEQLGWQLLQNVDLDQHVPAPDEVCEEARDLDPVMEIYQRQRMLCSVLRNQQLTGYGPVKDAEDEVNMQQFHSFWHARVRLNNPTTVYNDSVGRLIPICYAEEISADGEVDNHCDYSEDERSSYTTDPDDWDDEADASSLPLFPQTFNPVHGLGRGPMLLDRET